VPGPPGNTGPPGDPGPVGPPGPEGPAGQGGGYADVSDTPPDANAPTITPPEGLLWVDTGSAAGEPLVPAPPTGTMLTITPDNGDVEGGYTADVTGNAWTFGGPCWMDPPGDLSVHYEVVDYVDFAVGLVTLPPGPAAGGAVVLRFMDPNNPTVEKGSIGFVYNAPPVATLKYWDGSDYADLTSPDTGPSGVYVEVSDTPPDPNAPAPAPPEGYLWVDTSAPDPSADPGPIGGRATQRPGQPGTAAGFDDLDVWLQEDTPGMFGMTVETDCLVVPPGGDGIYHVVAHFATANGAGNVTLTSNWNVYIKVNAVKRAKNCCNTTGIYPAISVADDIPLVAGDRIGLAVGGGIACFLDPAGGNQFPSTLIAHRVGP
jgi:hypothetical protein